MEEKKEAWNLRVFPSIARAFDALVAEGSRGDKGLAASAACLMFLLADVHERQKYIDCIKLAEGRGYDGTVFEAAKKAIEQAEAAEHAVNRGVPPKADGGRRSRPGSQQGKAG